MQLTETWVQLGSAGVVIQKHGQADVQLAYNAVQPTTEDRFALRHNDPAVFPNVADLPLWARAVTGTSEITANNLT